MISRFPHGIPAAMAIGVLFGPSVGHAQEDPPTPTFTNVAVHDPSVMRAGSTFYVYGSHLASASSTDLLNWTQLSTSPAAGNLLVPNAAVTFSEVLTWAQTTTFWAPDVIRLSDGRYRMYYCACKGDSPRSALGLAVADAPTGPFSHESILLKSGMWNLTSEDGTIYDATVHPNVVDPAVFYDQTGKLWMVYGSYSGGIFILQLDPTTGRVLSGQGYGKKLIGGNHARIEGSYVMYSPESEYYYLFLSFGGLDSTGGYNIRLGRSRNPDGPYLDAAGNDLTNVKGAAGTLFDDASIAPYGVKLVGGYQFLHAAGEPGSTSRGYVSPGHNSAYYDPTTGKYFLVFHTRFVGRGEEHEVRVHQMFVNADGWLVVAPQRYARETITATDAGRIVGNYKLINHGKAITATVSTSSTISLLADGSVTGAVTGRWQLSIGQDLTLVLAGTTYRGVLVRQWDDDTQRWVLTFTALSSGGVSVWGSKIAINTTPGFIMHPATQLAGAGTSVTLQVVASGDPAPTYVWRKNGVTIGGATSSSYTIAGVAVGDAGSYSVVATNSAGFATSDAATLTVGATTTLPVVTIQPASQSVKVGSSVTFNASASGIPAPIFQWQKNNVPISGATESLYTIQSVALVDAGSYTVTATNSVGSVTCNPAVLTVSAAPVSTISSSMDFNADGKSDLLWQNTSTGERSIWLMNGTTLTAGVSLGLSPTEWSIAAVADFNADGKPDLLWQNTLTGDRTFWLMNGTAFSSSASLGTYSTDLMIAGAGDFNSDGKPDLVWQNTSTGERSIWLMNGTTVSSIVDLGTLPPEWSIAGTGDFNTDGKCDLIWQNTVTGERAIWLMNGTTVTAGVALGVYPQLQISGTGDYNADGKTDILWTNTVTGERVIWLMNGTTMASSVSLGVVDLNWVLGRPVFRRALADFNNDGKSDIVWQNTTTGDRAIWIMNGTVARTGLSLGNYATNQWIAAIGDFNNDGKADLVWQNTSTGARSITLLNGTTILSTVALGIYGTEWSINTTGDFNADGKPDLVWTNNATGDRAIWLMDGTAFTGGADLGNVSTQLQVVGTGDFNSDGKTDILWQNSSTGVRTIWLMNGTAHTSTVTLGTYGPEWSIVGTGDYNADGKPDLLWQNTITGERALWLMNGATFLSSVTIGTFDPAWSIRN